MAPWLVRLASWFTPAFSQSESDLSPDSALPPLMGRGPHKQLRARPLVSIVLGAYNFYLGSSMPWREVRCPPELVSRAAVASWQRECWP